MGRFGHFWAGELARYYQVRAYSRTARPELPDGVLRVGEEELLKSEVVILCVSISSMKEVLERISPHLYSGQLVMDTCSVKIFPCRMMQEIIPYRVKIIATHPMFGPDSARNGLKGFPIVFCPLRCTPEDSENWIHGFGSMGLRVLEMTPDEHDREAAYTQGITHFMGRVFSELDLGSSDMATSGYKALLEIMSQTCNDPWTLFTDLQTYNPYTASMRTDLSRVILSMLNRLNRLGIERGIDGGNTPESC